MGKDSFFEKETLNRPVESLEALWRDHVTPGMSITDTITRPSPAPHAKPPSADEQLPESPPNYELIEMIGEGGMGVVYTARQTSINRIIALKVIKPQYAEDGKQQTEFITEAAVTGDLDHPNVVPIYDLGKNGAGLPFYAMKRVKGIPWHQVIKSKSLRENLGYLMRISDAVAYAHEKGVIHRDLKPENVMLGEYGEVLLMDWGLAVSVTKKGKAADIKQTASIGGTPAYMAPEMARGETGKIGIQSDIYLIGAVLFEIITGKPPHPGKTVMACLKNAAENFIPPHSIDNELLGIALKAMSTDPAKRFASVKEFQQKVHEYQSHAQSIVLCKKARKDYSKARHTDNYDDFSRAIFGFQEAIHLWTDNADASSGLDEAQLGYAECAYKKQDYDLSISLLNSENPSHDELSQKVLNAIKQRDVSQKRLALVNRIAICLMILIGVIVSFSYLRIQDEKEKAVDEKEKAVIAQLKEAVQRKRSDKLNYINQIAYAESKLKNSEVAQAHLLLNETNPEYRGWEYGRLMQLINLDQLTIAAHASGVSAVAFSPDGKLVASAAQSVPEVTIWDLEKAKPLRTLTQHLAAISAIDFSADGQRILTASWDKTAFISDVKTGELLLSITGHEGPLTSARFSPDGNRILTASVDGKAIVWDAFSGIEIRTVNIPDEKILSIAWARDGARIALGGDNGTAVVWNVKHWRQIMEVRQHTDKINSLLFHPDGLHLLTAGEAGEIVIWNEITGEEKMRLKGHQNAITSLALSRDGDQLISGSKDHTAKIWNLRTGMASLTLKGHSGEVTSVYMHPAGPSVITGSTDGTIKIWNSLDENATIQLNTQGKAISAIAFSPDGSQFISAGWDGSFCLRDTENGTIIYDLRQVGMSICAATFNWNGQKCFLGHNNGSISVWNIGLHAVESSLDGHQAAVSALAVSLDGNTLVSGSKDGTALIWNLKNTSTPIKLEGHSGEIRSVDISPNGKMVVTGGWEKTENKLNQSNVSSIQLWEVLTGKSLGRFNYASDVTSVVFSPDGKFILSAGSEDKTIRLWDLETKKEHLVLSGHTGSVLTACFTPDGKRIISGSSDKTLIFWEPETGREIMTLSDQSGAIEHVTFSPDGLTLLASSADNTLNVWKALNWNMAAGQLRDQKTAAWVANARHFLCPDDSGMIKEREYRIGMIPGICSSILNVADCKEFWKKEGIHVKVVTLPDPKRLHEALISGEIQIALQKTGFLVDHYLKDKNLMIIGETGWAQGDQKIIIKDGLNLNHLKNQTIGIYDDHPSIVFLLHTFLKQHDLDLADINLVKAEPESLTNFFLANNLEIMINHGFQAMRAKNEGAGTIIATSASFPGVIPEALAILKKNAAAFSAEDLKKIFLGWFQALEWSKHADHWREYCHIINSKTFPGRKYYSDNDIFEMLASTQIHGPYDAYRYNQLNGQLIKYINDFVRFREPDPKAAKNIPPQSMVDNAALLKALQAIQAGRQQHAVPDTYQKPAVVRLATSDWPPYSSKNMAHFGAMSRILTEAFAQEGIQVRHYFLSKSNKCLVQTRKGLFEGSPGYSKTPERERDFIFSDPIFQDQSTFFHRKSHLFDWRFIDDIKNDRLGVTKGYDYGIEIANAIKKGLLQTVTADSDLENLIQLIKGKIDIFPIEVSVGNHLLRQNFAPEQIDLLTYHTRPLYQYKAHLILPRINPDSQYLVKLFNRGLGIIKRQGKVDQYIVDAIKGKYDRSKTIAGHSFVTPVSLTLTNGEWPPFASRDLDDFGIFSKIVTQAFAMRGINVTYQFPGTWKEAYEIAKAGKCDGSIAWSKNPEREKDFLYSDPVKYETIVLFHKKGFHFNWKTIDDLKGFRVGITSGYSYEPVFTQAEKKGILRTLKTGSDRKNFDNLLKGRIDLFPCEIEVGYSLLRKYFTKKQADTLLYHPIPLSSKPLHLILSKKRGGGELLISLFNEGLKQLHENGLFDAYINQARQSHDNQPQQSESRTLEEKPLSIHLATLDWPPYIGKGLHQNGFIAEIVREAFKATGYHNINIHFGTWDQSIKGAQQGLFDGLFPEYYDASQRKDFIYSDAFPGGPLVFLKRKQTTVHFEKGLQDLKPYKIGVVKSYLNWPEFDAADYLNKIESPDDESNLGKLADGSVDLIVIDKLVAEYLIAETKPSFVNQTDTINGISINKPLYIAFSKKTDNYDQKRLAFNKGLKVIQQNGKLADIIRSFGLADTIKAPKTDNVISVVSNIQPPFNNAPQSELPGYMIEVLKNIFEPQGYRIDFKTMPWKYALNSVKQGKFDAILRVTKNESQGFVFPKEVFGLLNEQFMVKRESPRQFGCLNALDDLRLGGVFTYSYGPKVDAYFENNRQSDKIIWARGSNPIQYLIDKILSNQIDAFIAMPQTVQWLLKENGKDPTCIISAGTPLNKWRPFYIAFDPNKKNSRKYAKIFDQGIRKLRQSGKLTLIFQKYGVLDWQAVQKESISIFTEDYPPLSFNKAGLPAGFSVDIVRSILSQVNQPDNITLSSWTDAYHKTLQEPNTAIFTTRRTKHRENLFKWVGPLVRLRNVFYTKKGKGIALNSLEEAKKVNKIFVYADSVYEQYLKKEGFTNLEIDALPGTGLQKLMVGQVDLMFIASIIMPQLSQLNGFTPDDFEEVFEATYGDSYIAFSKQTPDTIVHKWQKALDGLKRGGCFKKLYTKWMPGEPVPDATLVLYPQPESSTDRFAKYHLQQLKEALELTKDTYGAYQLRPSKNIKSTDYQKQLEALKKDENQLHVMVDAATSGMERVLQPVPIPLKRGLDGYQILLTCKSAPDRYADIETLEDLKSYSVGQKRQSAEEQIFSQNGFKVVSADSNDRLMQLLTDGACDFYPIGIGEAPAALAFRRVRAPCLQIENTILLHYPYADYFWFSKSKKGRELAARVESGLTQMIQNGSFNKRFFNQYGKAIHQANLNARKVFALDNENLSATAPLDRKELWYDPLLFEAEGGVEGHEGSRTDLFITASEYRPVIMLQNGHPSGYGIEVVQALQKRMGTKNPIHILPFKEAYERACNHENTVMVGISRTVDREPLFKWVAPIISYQLGLYARKDSAISIHTMEHAKQAGKIATVAGFSSETFLKKQGFTNIQSHPSAREAIQSLKEGWVDLWITGTLMMSQNTLDAGVDPGMFELVFIVKEEPGYIAFSKNTADAIIQPWQTAFSAIKQDGSLDRLKTKWFGRMDHELMEMKKGQPVSKRLTAAEIEKARGIQLKILTEEWPPANFTSNGNLTGFSVEIVKEILKRQKKSDVIEVRQWTDAYQSALSEPDTVIFSMTRTAERNELFKWAGPLFSIRVHFYARKDSGLKIKALDDAKQVHSIVTVKDDSNAQFLKQHGFNNVKVLDNPDETPVLLAEGKADLWMVSNLTAFQKINKAGYDLSDFEALYQINEIQLYIGFSKQTPDLVIRWWQQILDDMKRDGSFKKICQKWLPPGSAPAMPTKSESHKQAKPVSETFSPIIPLIGWVFILCIGWVIMKYVKGYRRN